MKYSEKVVWGLGKMTKHIRAVVLSSRFIPTDEKEPLIGQYEKLVDTLSDAIKRESGAIPHTPEYLKKWNDGLKKREKSRKDSSVNENVLLKEFIHSILTDK